MAHICQERALGAIGRFGRFLRLLQMRFGPLLLSHVPKDGLRSDDPASSVANRRFHHVDVTDLAVLLVLLDCLEEGPRFRYPSVVATVLLRQFRRVKIEIRFPHDLAERPAQELAKRLAGKREPSLEVLAENLDGQVLDQRRVTAPRNP